MSYSSDLTDEQWTLLEPVFNAPGKRGPKHAVDLRSVVDAMLYISHTGCQWRFLPESFGPWTRAWSQFRRWSRNGTWARALTVLHEAARRADGRAAATPSMVVIDTHLARGASNGGVTFHDRGGPYGGTKGAKRARRSGPRPPRPLPPAGEVVREHHHLGHRLAPGCLHHDHPAPPVTRTGPSTGLPPRRVSGYPPTTCSHGTRQILVTAGAFNVACSSGSRGQFSGARGDTRHGAVPRNAGASSSGTSPQR